MSTLTEVRTNEREGHEVSLHCHLLAALGEHLFKDTGVEAGGEKNQTVTFKGHEKSSAEEMKAEERLTKVWRALMSRRAFLPHCLPSWCETGSCSSP